MDSEIEDNSRTYMNMTRKALYDLIKESCRTKFEEKMEYLETKLIHITKCPEEKRKDIKHQLSRFKTQFKQKWTAARNTEANFLKKNEQWLTGTVKIQIHQTVSDSSKTGRPEKSFSESSERSKRRKTEELRVQTSAEVLSFATHMSLRKHGQVDAAKVVKEITQTTPTRAQKYRNAIKTADKTPKQLSQIEALSVFVEAELTRRQYEIIRKADPRKFPCYSVLQRAKSECYLPKESYRVTSTSAELELQPLMDLTTSRLCLNLNNVLEVLPEGERNNLQLISKWGCDGSQQCQYKQKFESSSESDANIFQSSFVYLQLVSNINNKKKVIWQNPTPASPRYCRPIRIRFVHETTDIINEEVNYIEDKIKALQKTELHLNFGSVIVEHKLLFTMVDGKNCNAVTGTKYTQRCYICGQTSKNFNKLNDLNIFEPSNTESMRFGLSILHARIRFFESMLHLSYKLPIKEWQVKKNSPNQKIVEERKKVIQQAFKEELGLLVDFPKQGFGNTNDGNSSRRFYSDVKKASEITGLDENLLYRQKIILETISSGLKIDTEKFEKYAVDTAKLYVELYGWYPMPPTVHKVLIHGAAVISSAILPIGQLSEEAAEARNKHFRQYRLEFSRKFSREDCNRDIVNRLLLRSDPVLTGLKPKSKKKTKPFSKETLEMLLPEEISDIHVSGAEEDDKDDDDDRDSDDNDDVSNALSDSEYELSS